MTKKKNRTAYYVLTALFLVILVTVLFIAARSRLVHYYEIQSDEGFSFEDVRLMNTLPSVRNAYAIVDKKSSSGEAFTVYTLHGNPIDIAEGRMPANDKEVLIDSKTALSFKPGDYIYLGDEEYKVTGIVDNKGVETAFIFCLPAALHDDKFNRMGVEIHGGKSVEEILNGYAEDLMHDSSARASAENEKLIDQLREKFSLIDDASSDKLQMGKEELDDAYGLLSDGEKQIRDYEKQIADGESELASYDKLLSEGLGELINGKEQLDKAKAEIQDARRQLDAELAKYGYSIEDLPEAEKTIKDYEKQIADAKKELASSKNELADGLKILTDGKSKLDAAKAEINAGREKINAELEKYGLTIDELAGAEKALSDYTKQYSMSVDELYALALRYSSYKGYIISLRDSCSELIELLKKKQDEYDEKYNERIEKVYSRVCRYYEEVKDKYIRSGLELSIDSVAAIKEECGKIISLFENADYLKLLVENKDKIEEATSAYNLLKSYEQEYNVKYKEYQDGLDTYNEGKREYNEARSKLKDAEKELEEKKKAVSDAVSAWNQINDAQKEYDEKYKEYQAGLEKYESEKARYDEAYAGLEAARAEIGEAKTELDLNKGEYEKEKERFDEVSADIDDELDSISREIKKYEDIADKSETAWRISDCIRIRDDENAFVKAGIIFIIICIVLLTVGKIRFRNRDAIKDNNFIIRQEFK